MNHNWRDTRRSRPPERPVIDLAQDLPTNAEPGYFSAVLERGRARLRAGWPPATAVNETWYAWTIKGDLRAVYRAGDEHAAPAALSDFYDAARAADIPEALPLAAPSDGENTPGWPTTAATGLSNARTEAINGLTEKILRMVGLLQG